MTRSSAISRRRRGRFIVLEGIDGAGTTTQSRLLCDWLRSIGRSVLPTREPSDGPIGHMIRAILSGRLVVRESVAAGSPRVRALDPAAIALLFAADRIDHLDNEVQPALARGIEVVSDRYYHSSLAYQSQDCPMPWVQQINRRAMAPDVTYLLDVPVCVGARRRRARLGRDLFENDAFQIRVERSYRSLRRLLPEEDIVVLDGTRSVEEIQSRIQHDLILRFGWKIAPRRG
ncbi:MAG: dTMP kinase [Myxococcales bacterium]|nr:dTMP kinase [Myxococcales bacterium]